MKVFTRLSDFTEARDQIPPSKSIGLVPTMGALHAGHASLVQRSVADNELTIVTIFVNPTQFGPNEDLSTYPRTLEADIELLKSLGANWVLAPQVDEVYAKESFFSFQIHSLADRLCGASRPGHMEGVVQVVSILFNIIHPKKAYFGLKDYQQFIIIRHLAKAFHTGVEIIGCPIVRESDGLALSSRNVYLSSEAREQALFLSKCLQHIKSNWAEIKTPKDLRSLTDTFLSKFPLVKLDYIEVLDADNLEYLDSFENTKTMHAFVAAFLGKTRLIDNLRIQ